MLLPSIGSALETPMILQPSEGMENIIFVLSVLYSSVMEKAVFSLTIKLLSCCIEELVRLLLEEALTILLIFQHPFQRTNSHICLNLLG